MRTRLALACSALIASGALAAWGDDAAPDFAGVLFTKKYERIEGKRRLLAILWDSRGGQKTPTREDVEKRLFGPRESVADWFRENSGGKLVLEKAGCLGWYPADKPASHYWPPKPLNDAKDLLTNDVLVLRIHRAHDQRLLQRPAEVLALLSVHRVEDWNVHALEGDEQVTH